MVAALSVMSLVSGGSVAWAAAHASTRAAGLERWGGALLVVGLGLLGAGLQSLHG